MDDELKKKLERILNRLVKAEVQENLDSLPAAAWENRHLAILSLSKLLPDYEFQDVDFKQELENIREIYQDEVWQTFL
jgi:hypothetical protein